MTSPDLQTKYLDLLIEVANSLSQLDPANPSDKRGWMEREIEREYQQIKEIEAIANNGLRAAVDADPALAKGVNAIDGKLTYEAVAEAHGIDYTPLRDVLPLSAV